MNQIAALTSTGPDPSGAHGCSEPELLAFPICGIAVTPAFCAWLGNFDTPKDGNLRAFLCDDAELVLQRVQPSDYFAHGSRFMVESAFAAGSLVKVPLSWNMLHHFWILISAAQWQSLLIKSIAEIAKAIVSLVVARLASNAAQVNTASPNHQICERPWQIASTTA